MWRENTQRYVPPICTSNGTSDMYLRYVPPNVDISTFGYIFIYNWVYLVVDITKCTSKCTSDVCPRYVYPRKCIKYADKEWFCHFTTDYQSLNIPNRNKVEQCLQCGMYAHSDNLARHMERKHLWTIKPPSPSLIILPSTERRDVNDCFSRNRFAND